MTEEKSNLEELKETYAQFQKKHDLPLFEELNRDFGIERLSEQETDFFLREVRRHVADNLDNFLRFIEIIINPSNAPMFLYPLIKSIGEEEKEKLSKIHQDIARLEIELMKMISYSEELEIAFIKKAYTLWQEIKENFVSVIEIAEGRLDKDEKITRKNYFG